jgi:RNase P subunit RPR2
MNVKNLNKIERECRRFLAKVNKAKKRLQENPQMVYEIVGCKETGAARRASMDLSMALVEFRKS